MDNTLSWNNHVDLLMKKLSVACYVISNAKTYMSASSLKIMLSFTRLRAMELYFGENLRTIPQFLAWGETIRIMEGCGNRVLCRNLLTKLQILHLASQYILFLLMSVVPNKNLFSTNIENHNIDTRQRNNL